MANIEDLDDDFILCNVCNNEYDESQRAPKLLPCLHTVCNDCALNSASGSVLKCAMCDGKHTIGSDLNFLKDNTMLNMMEMIKLQRKPNSILCSDCPDSNNGDVFCKDCYVFLCKECTSAHKRTQLTRRHVLLTLDELKSAGIGSFTRKEMCSLPGHEDQPFSFYCENEECQKPVCTQCVVGDHSQANGHVIRSLNDTYEETKLQVERLIGELLGKISEVSSDAKTLESETNVIDEKRVDITKQIDDMFDNLEAVLKKRREKLKHRVEVICEERKKATKDELDQLQKGKSDMENACNYSSRMLVFTNKPEFLQLKNVVVTKLTDLVNDEHIVPKTEAIELRFDECVETDKFEELVQSIGEIHTNIYKDGEEENTSKMNGFSENGSPKQYVLPYKGSPKTPPGKFMANKYPEMRPTRETKQPPKMESLKLDLTAATENRSSSRASSSSSYKSASPSSNDNPLGRPLSLKSPVISTGNKPTSLGDFLNDLHHQAREIIREKKNQWMLEAQDPSEKEMPKSPTPTTPTPSPVGRYPGTPPYTPPVYAAQTQSTTRNQPYGSLTSPIRKDVTSPSVNGESPFSPTKSPVNSRSMHSPIVPKLNLYGPTSYSKTKQTNGCLPMTTATLKPTTSTTTISAMNSTITAKTNALNTSMKNNNKFTTDQKSPEQTGSIVRTANSKARNQSVKWNLEKMEETNNDVGNKAEMTSPTTPRLTESSFSEVRQPSPRKSTTDKPVVFGDISCPDFQLDGTSAHHEREVSSDRRTLRNKKTDMFGGSSIDIENSLVQYKGAIGTQPFQDPGKYYYEVDVVYNIQQPLEETWLVFEIGLCRLDDVDLHHTVERHEYARSFYVARYPEDGKLTQEFWHNRDLLSFSPLSDNTAGIEVRITYGLLVDTRRKKWIVTDCNNNKILHSFDGLDFTEALYPVFGCYNPDLCTVELTLKTGSEITMVPQCLKSPGYRSP